MMLFNTIGIKEWAFRMSAFDSLMFKKLITFPCVFITVKVLTLCFVCYIFDDDELVENVMRLLNINESKAYIHNAHSLRLIVLNNIMQELLKP